LYTEKLVDLGSENSNGDNCLTVAAASNQLKIVMWLTHVYKPDINFQNAAKQSALAIAAYWGHSKMVQFLLTVPGIKIDHSGYFGVTALHQAAYYGHLNIVRVLVHAGADHKLIGDGKTPVCSAVFNNKIEIVQWFLRRKLVDLSNPNLMHTAECLGRLGIMKVLLQYGKQQHDVLP
jgi:ankyrin repeat protein